VLDPSGELVRIGVDRAVAAIERGRMALYVAGGDRRVKLTAQRSAAGAARLATAAGAQPDEDAVLRTMPEVED
jgi:hypothetical protein